jgi:predicted transcriptional regulator of viral defense system
MNNKIDTTLLNRQFKYGNIFGIDDLRSLFYNNQDVSKPQINWTAHSLAKRGIIQRVARGKYRLGTTQCFVPDLSPKAKKPARLIKKEFPYLDFCIWELNKVNFFAHNLINFNVIFADVERVAVETVYRKFKDENIPVYNIKKTYEDLIDMSGAVCIRPLITGAPLQSVENIPTASLEKILVDLYTDKEFISFQGTESETIYNSAFTAYTINTSKLLRYASRKGKRDKVNDLLKTINRQ